jgi:predicted ATP-dependent endonuclease of OLD family
MRQDTTMRIDQMTLKNYRRFEELRCEFHPELNVIIGVNGEGKTTILDALAVGLGSLFLGLDEIPTRTIRAADATASRYTISTQTYEEHHYPVELSFSGAHAEETLTWSRSLRRARPDQLCRGQSAQITW